MTDTATLITQLRILAQLTRTEAQVARLRVAQASGADVRSELRDNAADADRRAARIAAALRDLGALPDPVTPVLGRVAAMVRGALEQAQPLDEALLGDLVLEHQLRDRARYVGALADAAGLPAVRALADELDGAHAETVDWLNGVLARLAAGQQAALDASPLQQVAAQITRAANAPGRAALDEAGAAVTRTVHRAAGSVAQAGGEVRTAVGGVADRAAQLGEQAAELAVAVGGEALAGVRDTAAEVGDTAVQAAGTAVQAAGTAVQAAGTAVEDAAGTAARVTRRVAGSVTPTAPAEAEPTDTTASEPASEPAATAEPEPTVPAPDAEPVPVALDAVLPIPDSASETDIAPETDAAPETPRDPIPGFADLPAQAAIAALRTLDDPADVRAVLAAEEAHGNRPGVVAAARIRADAVRST